jgi:hypothetical protein
MKSMCISFSKSLESIPGKKILRSQSASCIFEKPIGFILSFMRREIFQAISEPTRRAILVLINVQAMTPNAISGALRYHPPIDIQAFANLVQMQYQ